MHPDPSRPAPPGPFHPAPMPEPPENSRIASIAIAVAVVLCIGIMMTAALFWTFGRSTAATPAPSATPAASVTPTAPPTVDPADVAAWPALPALPASREKTVRAQGSGKATRIAFANTTAGPVTIHWLNDAGERVAYATLAPGDSYVQDTYAGHVWVAVAADGTALALFRSADAPGQAVIR